MSFSKQFSVSLSLELAKVLPIRSAISYSAESLVTFFRQLKRSGSDFLVEEDLAAIFGRAKVESPLENDFRIAVREMSIIPFHNGSQIVLDGGPGPTLLRALKDRYYLSSVIQLSFLTWTHEQTTLAAALEESMRIRYESNVSGATPDPDYDGILRTLRACSSQTSQFRWDDIEAAVMDRFPKSKSWICKNRGLSRTLPPNLLLGAMDYFHLAQSFPEDRFVKVDSQVGFISIIIWAHYILGLQVIVKDSPDGYVSFGNAENFPVTIRWSQDLQLNRLYSGSKGNDYQHLTIAPIIYLLDSSEQVVLMTEPTENEGVKIDGQEYHRLRGYGTTFYQRIFNRSILVDDDDPIFAEAANFAIALALVLSKSMRRVPFRDQVDEKKYKVPNQCYLGAERWRILDASKLLFWDIELDKKTIKEYIEGLAGVRISDMKVPPGINQYLQKLEDNTYFRNREKFFEDIKEVASWILAFAQVVEIESCADLPLAFAPGFMYCTGVLNWEGLEPIDMESEAFFNLVLKMMKDTGKGEHVVDSDGIFLTCHSGWSLFYNSVMDQDPGRINCELLSIKRGVPTSTRTGERKYRINDAPAVDMDVRTPLLIEKGDSYRPRSVYNIRKRIEHYSSRTSEFWLSIRFDVETPDLPTFALRQRRTGPYKMITYPIYASHAQFHKALWGVVKTVPCSHPSKDDEALPLDLGVVTVGGLTWANGNGDAPDYRIRICLVKGDARARWLVIHGLLPNSNAGALNTQVLLRCDDCCETCAASQASAMRGQWLVVL
ncbi:MAG: hypothetical protein Q9222_002747 [Ikaeria aurantiellina]